MKKIKRLWLKLTNKDAYFYMTKTEELIALINEKRRRHEKTSGLQKELYLARANFEWAVRRKKWN